MTPENVIDVLQLAKRCDAPRLSLICIRMIVKDFKAISSTQGWKVMKRVDPALEQELLEAVVEADSVSQFSPLLYSLLLQTLETQISVMIVSTLHFRRKKRD